MDKNNQILPVIDNELLQKKANEYAQKGAEEVIRDFYTGYDSPYKKAIKENLVNKGVDNSIAIPDIIGILNDGFSKEVDLIANTAISKTFIPMVKEFLSREDAEINFSDILKKFIETTDFDWDENDTDDYSVELADRNSGLDSFKSLTISNREIGYQVSFYHKDKKENKWEIYTLPYTKDDSGKYYSRDINQKMKITLDGGATLELPFIKGILEDKFISFIARLVIGNNQITFDCDDFNEDLFPERDHCHC